MLCTVLLIVSSASLWSQVINNTGGAVLSVVNGAVLNADIITNDNFPSIVDNQGTINVTTFTNNGTMQGNGSYNIIGTFTNTGTFTPGTSVFDFSSSSPQTIPAINYYNLTSSGSGARTLANSGTIGISGVFTPGTNSYTITGSTIDFNGSGAQTIPAFNYNNLTSSSTGTRTLDNSGTIGIAGTFTPGSNSYTITSSTIDFNGSGGQTIPTFNFNNLTSSSTGARTLVNGGTIGIAGTFTPGTNAYTITGNTIDFNGSGAQTINAFNGVTGYNNLTISNSGTKSSPSGTTTTVVAGNLTLNSGITYEEAVGATSTLTLNGTANTISGELGSVANPFATINLGNGNADATTISASTGSLNAATVAIGAFTITVTNNNIARISGNLTGGAAGATWVNAANASLTVGGSLLTTGTLTATANPNSITYNSATGAQTVKGTTYHDLIIDKAGQIGTIGAATIVNGDVTVTNGTLALAAFAFTASGTTNVNGTLSVTSATGTKSFADLNLNANSILTASAAATFNVSGNLTMGNSSSITGSATNVISVTGNLNISGTSVTIGNSTITVTDTTLITGDVNFNSATGTKTFIGPVVISSGASWSSSSNSAFTLRNGLIHNGTSFSSGTGIYTFITNAQTLNGTSQLTFANLTSTGITLTDSNSHASGLTITTALAGTGGLTMPTNGLLTLGGTSTITTLTVTANPNTVVYNSTTAAQTVKGTTYHDLIINKTAQVATIGAATVVNGDVTVTSGTLALPAFAFTASGTTNVSGTLSVSSNTGAKSFVDLNLNSNSILTFSAAATIAVTGNLTMGNSSTITGTNTGVINVTNNLNVTGTSVSIGRSTITVTDSTLITGDVNFNSATGTKTFVGPVVISSGASWSSSSNSAFTLRNGLIHDGTSFSSGTGIYTFNTNSQTLNGSSQLTFANLTVTGAAVTLTDSNSHASGLTITTALAGTGGLTMPTNGLLTLGGTSAITTLTVTANPNTVVYNSTTAAQTVKATTYHDLVIDKTAQNASITATSTVNGDITVTSGTLTISGGTFVANGTTTVEGTLALGAATTSTFNDSVLVDGTINITSATGTKIFAQPLLLNSGSVWNNSANEAITIRNGLVFNGTTFTSGTGVYTFDTNPQSISGSSQLIFGSVTITGVTVSNDNTNVNGLTVSTALIGTGGLTNPINRLLNIGGTSTITTLTATASPNTVKYTSTTGAQTVKGTTYHHLIIDKTAQVATMGALAVVNGDVTVTSGTLALAAFAFTASGTTDVSGTLSVTSATGAKSFVDLNLNSSSILTISAAGATLGVSGNLSMGNSSSITGSATGIINVTDNLNITGTGTTIGRSTITVTDTTLVTGDVDFNSVTGVKTFVGPVVVSTGASWSNSLNSPFTLRGGLTHNGTSFSSGTGVYTFNTNPQTIDGSSQLTIANLTATGVTVSNDNSNVGGLTVSTTLAGTGGLTNLTNRLLNIGGASTITTLTATANPNTVNYNGSSAQSVVGTNYYHLTLSNAADTSVANTKTAAAALFVAGVLTINSGNSLDMTTFNTSTFGGSSVNNGKIKWTTSNVYVAGTGTTELYGSTPSTLAPGSNYGNILFTGAGIMTIAGSVTATGGDASVGITVSSNLTVNNTGSLTITGMDLNNNGSITNDGTINVP